MNQEFTKALMAVHPGLQQIQVSGAMMGIISARGLSINPVNTTLNALYMGVWHRLGNDKSTNNADSWTNTPLDVKVYNMDLDNVSPNVLYLANFDPGKS